MEPAFDLPPKKCEFRCVRLLQLLTLEEVRAFRKYLNSPYFRVSEAIVRLADQLLRLAPAFPQEKLTKAVLFKKVYGRETAFKEKKIRDLLSDLALHLDEFIGIERIRHDKVMRRRLVVERVAGHNDLDLMHRELHSLEKAIQQRPDRSIAYYTDSAFALKCRIALPKQDSVRNRRAELDELSDYSDRAIALQKGNLLLHLRNRRRALNTPYQNMAEQQIVRFIRASDDPVFRVYSAAIDNIEESELKILEEQIEICKRHADMFGYQELIDFYALATNAANRLDDKFRKAGNLLAWEWTTFIISVIQAQPYPTHVGAGLLRAIYAHSFMVGQQAVVMRFIDALTRRGYNSTELDAVVHFIYAHYHFMAGNLEEAATHISRADFNIPTIGLTGRSLQIRIYFEQYFKNPTHYEEVLTYAIQALGKYSARYNKVNSSAASGRIAVLNCFKNLFKLSKATGEDFEALYGKFETDLSPIVGGIVYNWAIAQANLLKQQVRPY